MFDVLRGSTPRSVTTTEGGKLQGAADSRQSREEKKGAPPPSHHSLKGWRGRPFKLVARRSWKYNVPRDNSSSHCLGVGALCPRLLWEQNKRGGGVSGREGHPFFEFQGSKTKPCPHLSLTSPAQASCCPLRLQRAELASCAETLQWGREGNERTDGWALRGGGWVDGGHHAFPKNK
jgi:hypothetical protein